MTDRILVTGLILTFLYIVFLFTRSFIMTIYQVVHRIIRGKEKLIYEPPIIEILRDFKATYPQRNGLYIVNVNHFDNWLPEQIQELKDKIKEI